MRRGRRRTHRTAARAYNRAVRRIAEAKWSKATHFFAVELVATVFDTNVATVTVDVMRAQRAEYRFAQFPLPTPKGA